MRELHLFAGAGGGILGGMLLGHTPVGAVEIDPFARAVLQARQADGSLPDFPIYEDVRTFDGTAWRDRVDIIAGGFPCQDLSCAGKGAGIDGARSGLWWEMLRVIREARPRYVFLENVPAITGRALDRVLGSLADLGLDAEWFVLSAADVGAPHLRKRWWCLARDTVSDHEISECCVSKGRTPNLQEMAQQWPTPRASKTTDEDEAAWMARKAAGKVSTPPLSLAVRMLPTPTANDARNGTRRSGAFQSLTRTVQQWPTPTTQDANNNGGPSQHQRDTIPLNAAVLRIPTPTAGDAKSSGSRNSPTCNANPGTSLTDFVREDGGTGRQDAPKDSPKLNPEWVELLMGWPRGWTQVDGYKPPRGKKAGKTTARASSSQNPPTAQTD